MHSVLRPLTTPTQGGPIQITQTQDEVTGENESGKRWMAMGMEKRREMNGWRCY